MMVFYALIFVIGAVRVLGGLSCGRLDLAAKQGRESLHNRAVSEPPTGQWGIRP